MNGSTIKAELQRSITTAIRACMPTRRYLGPITSEGETGSFETAKMTFENNVQVRIGVPAVRVIQQVDVLSSVSTLAMSACGRTY